MRPRDRAPRCSNARRSAYEAQHRDELFALLAREAGKTLLDAWPNCARRWISCATTRRKRVVARSRAPRGRSSASPLELPAGDLHRPDRRRAGGRQRGFGQAGRADAADRRMRSACTKAGIAAARQLLPGGGATVGAALTRDPRSTGGLHRLDRHRPGHPPRDGRHLPGTPLIAETGGLNAMIVDSTALPEQAVRDIVALPFRAPGSAARRARSSTRSAMSPPPLLAMLFGAMAELVAWATVWFASSTAVGPVIDARFFARLHRSALSRRQRSGGICCKLDLCGHRKASFVRRACSSRGRHRSAGRRSSDPPARGHLRRGPR